MHPTENQDDYWDIEDSPVYQAIRSTLGALFETGAPAPPVVEMRVFDLERKGTVSGYFNNLDLLAKAVTEFDGKGAVTVTLNQINPALLARNNNRYEAWAKVLTTDKEVIRRRWMMIDCDPKRPAKISSTDAEHDAALEKGREIQRWLGGLGWCDPIAADSGNGCHLLYPLDLPNDEPSTKLVEGVIKLLAARFSDDVVEVDEAVWNAARLIKIHGTIACKGDTTQDRPHRRSKLLFVPKARGVVTAEQMAALLTQFSPEVAPATITAIPPVAVRSNPGSHSPSEGFDVVEFLEKHSIGYKEVPDASGTKYVLDACPFNDQHTAPDSAVFKLTSGAVAFKCFHNSCSGNGWREFRLHYDPDAYAVRDRIAEIKSNPPGLPPAPQTAHAWDFTQCLPDPAGEWLVAEGRISRIRVDGKGNVSTEQVLAHTLYIAERSHDIDTQTESLTLVWNRDGDWKRATVSQSVVADNRSILQLAERGCLVNSLNARDVVAYVAHLLDFHQANIPLTYLVSTTGYKTLHAQRLYLWGETVLSGSETAPAIAFNPDSDSAGVLGAIRAEGTLAGWVEMIQPLGAFPIAAFGVLAGFLPAFVRDMGLIQNPIVDFAGRSCSGKTTMMRLIASIWGYPPEGRGGLIKSWNSTPVFIERLAGLMNDMPVFLDESHNARPEAVQNSIYQYGNGTGRGRGARDGGVQKQAAYCGVLVSAGEARLADASSHDGAQARILGFWGSPFGEDPQAQRVHAINKGVLENFGHAGPSVVKAYLGNRETWLPTLKEVKDESFTRLTQHKASDGLAERLAALCAAVEAVGRLVNHWLDLGWDLSGIIDAAFARLTENRKDCSAVSSLELVGSWAIGRRNSFLPHGGAVEVLQQAREILGRMVGAYGKQRFAFLPDHLKVFAERHGYRYDAMLAQWRDNGWLDADEDRGRYQKRLDVMGMRKRLVVLSSQGMHVAMGGNPYQTDPNDTDPPETDPPEAVGDAGDVLAR